MLLLPAVAQQSLLSTQIPQTSNATLPWELGVSLTFDMPGMITALRFYKVAGRDAGPHVGHIWSVTGALLASVTFMNETPAGWQQQALAAPFAVSIRQTVVISVSSPNGANYALLPAGFPLTNGHLTASAGAYSALNTYPALPTPTNYFRDVIFTPNPAIGTDTLVPDTMSNAFISTLNGFDPGVYTLSITIQNAAGINVSTSIQMTMPPKAPQ